MKRSRMNSTDRAASPGYEAKVRAAGLLKIPYYLSSHIGKLEEAERILIAAGIPVKVGMVNDSAFGLEVSADHYAAAAKALANAVEPWSSAIVFETTTDQDCEAAAHFL